MNKDKPKDILEENRLDNIARTQEHNWNPDKPARKKPKLCPGCGKPMKETKTGWECIHEKEGVTVEY